MSVKVESEVLTHDAHFYIDEMVIFQVEDALFRLQNTFWFLPDGFRSDVYPMFTIPLAPEANGVVEGSRDDCPIKLDGIRKAEFQSFASLMYPINTGGISPQSVADWDDRLSNMWNFTKSPATARGRLQHLLTPASEPEKVRLGQKYGFRAWVKTGYLQLVEHSGVLQPVDDLLVSGLSAKELCRVLMIREKLHVDEIKNHGVTSPWNSKLERIQVELGGEKCLEVPVFDELLLCSTGIPSRESPVKVTRR